jgi:hypothetical protein
VRSATERIAVLLAWRRGGLLAGMAATTLTAGGWLGQVGPLAGVLVAALIAGGTQLALCGFVRRCALYPDLAGIPIVKRYCRRLCSVRRRHGIARELRWLASPPTRALENDLVRWDRVTLVRGDLQALAQDVERAETVEPRTIVELTDLLSDGARSPLFNPEVPIEELTSRLLCLRFRLACAKHPPPWAWAARPSEPVDAGPPAAASGQR